MPEPRSLPAALRRQGWIILACALGGTALFGTASALSPKVYESRAEVTVSPVSLQNLFGAPDAPTTPEQAIAREMDVVRSDAVLGRAEDQISFEHTLTVEQVDEDTIAFVGRSIDEGYAEAVADTAATTYFVARQETATGLATNAVDITQRIVDDLTARQAAGEDVAVVLAEQQDLLAGFLEGQAAQAETAVVTLAPTDAADPISPHPWQAAAKGLVVGLVAGLLVAAAREYARARPVPGDLTDSLPKVVVSRRDGESFHLGWAQRRRPAFLVLTGLVVARAALYAYQGANFVLDDWSLEYQRVVAGTWSSVPTGQDLVNARPGAWLTFTLIHGIVGPHPLIHFAVLTAINLALVLVLYLVLARFVDRSMALLVTAIWVLLPTHQSMTVWSGTSQVAVGALVFVLGLWAFTHGRWVLAGLGFAASILCYELSVPAAVAASVLVATPLVPLRADATPPRSPIRLWTRGGTLVFVALATAWSRAHPVYDLELRMPSPATLWSGHFGVGIFGSLETPDRLVMLAGGLFAAGVVVCLVWWLAGARGRNEGPSVVVAGAAVFVLGLTVAFTSTTGVLGFNDRLYALSSIGGAMMVAGLGTFLWRRLPVITMGLGVLLLTAALAGQFVSLRSWSYAGGDVVALLNHIERTYPDPENTNFIVGPTPQYRNNVMGAISPYGGADAAFRLAFPGAGQPCQPVPAPCQASLVIANSTEEFVPTERGETLVEWTSVLGADGNP